MVEEFDLQTNELITRMVRKPTKLGGEGKWIPEYGLLDPVGSSELLSPSSSSVSDY